MRLLDRSHVDVVPTILATVAARRQRPLRRLRPSLPRAARARGICGVRENRDGTLWCLAYGAVAAAGLDPIEKKPLFHVGPGIARVLDRDRPAARSTARSARTGRSRRLRAWAWTFRNEALTPGQVVANAVRSGARSIAYTYVEPTVFLEYALDTGRLAREAGLRNLFITDGYATPEAVGLLAEVIDAANVDLKSFDDAFYRRAVRRPAGPRARRDRRATARPASGWS